MAIKIYRIFLKKTKKGVIEDLELIKEGFNMWAFMFQFFYLLYKKLWKQSLILFVIIAITNFLQYKYLSGYIIIPIQLGVTLYVAFEITDWLSMDRVKTGYEFLGYTSGNNEREAKLKFLENMNSTYSGKDKLEQKIF